MSCNRVEGFGPGCLRLFDHVVEDTETISKETIDVKIEVTVHGSMGSEFSQTSAQASGVRCQASGFGFQVSGFRCQVSGVRLQVSGFGFRVSAGSR